jgi:preprotein translocase subunit SecF
MPFLRFIPETTNVDFVKWRYLAFSLDGLLLVIAIVSMLVRGFNLGIDFQGGVLIEAKAQHAIDVRAVRSSLGSRGLNDINVQYFGGGTCDRPVNSCVLIRTKLSENARGESAAQAIKAKLGSDYTFLDTQVIGPKVSSELFHNGVLATILAVIMIAIYVGFRFEWQYGVGALLATGHDVFVTAGLYSLAQLDFSINSVAALLLLAGYSINDTVVVFDRIRENRRKFKRMDLPELINLSTNQIATRTTLVSTAMVLVVLPLFLFGGPALFDFSAAILFGVVVGTFSSTYVAAALLLYLPPIAGDAQNPTA